MKPGSSAAKGYESASGPSERELWTIILGRKDVTQVGLRSLVAAENDLRYSSLPETRGQIHDRLV